MKINPNQLYTHKLKKTKYVVKRFIPVKLPNGKWEDYVLYYDLETGAEFVRSIASFQTSFKKEGT